MARLDRTLAAVADPTRRRLLHLLESGPATISELAADFAVSLPAVSRHLRVLSGAGLVRIRVNPADRRAKTCELNPRGLDEVREWIESTRAAWADRFDAMERVLRRDAKRRNQ